MKIDGAKNTFEYDSQFWSNKVTYNSHNLAIDEKETKLDSYWTMFFTEIRLGMRIGSTIQWLSFPYQAISLYDVIRDGKFREVDIGRTAWMSLVPYSSLETFCNKVRIQINCYLQPILVSLRRFCVLSIHI